jgi:hypothetical protein
MILNEREDQYLLKLINLVVKGYLTKSTSVIMPLIGTVKPAFR